MFIVKSLKVGLKILCLNFGVEKSQGWNVLQSIWRPPNPRKGKPLVRAAQLVIFLTILRIFTKVNNSRFREVSRILDRNNSMASHLELLMDFQISSTVIKVKTLWKVGKIWKNLPPVLTKQLFLLSSIKTSGRFFQIFVAFSEKLDFFILCYVS